MKDACAFCSKIAGTSKADVFYEDALWVAFAPLEPISRGHTLLVSRKHVKSLYDLGPEEQESLGQVAHLLAMKITKKFSAQGVNLLHASGEEAQQSVFHFHVHIVPRYSGDKLDLWFRSGL